MLSALCLVLTAAGPPQAFPQRKPQGCTQATGAVPIDRVGRARPCIVSVAPGWGWHPLPDVRKRLSPSKRVYRLVFPDAITAIPLYGVCLASRHALGARDEATTGYAR
jgi:hypothetical protein